ncbi:hypothetical protein [Salininema proteolyticum]|uniref:Uncharacterized protein n=1 Tax=Salininema proteolyticum TaxID=1607685 RepID=A0ABV8TTY3_9ACTN
MHLMSDTAELPTVDFDTTGRGAPVERPIPAECRSWLVINPADQLVEVGRLLQQRSRLREYDVEREPVLPTPPSLITMLV